MSENGGGAEAAMLEAGIGSSIANKYAGQIAEEVRKWGEQVYAIGVKCRDDCNKYADDKVTSLKQLEERVNHDLSRIRQAMVSISKAQAAFEANTYDPGRAVEPGAPQSEMVALTHHAAESGAAEREDRLRAENDLSDGTGLQLAGRESDAESVGTLQTRVRLPRQKPDRV